MALTPDSRGHECFRSRAAGTRSDGYLLPRLCCLQEARGQLGAPRNSEQSLRKYITGAKFAHKNPLNSGRKGKSLGHKAQLAQRPQRDLPFPPDVPPAPAPARPPADPGHRPRWSPAPHTRCPLTQVPAAPAIPRSPEPSSGGAQTPASAPRFTT